MEGQNKKNNKKKKEQKKREEESNAKRRYPDLYCLLILTSLYHPFFVYHTIPKYIFILVDR